MSVARQSSVSRRWDSLSLRAKLWLIGIPALVLVAALAAFQAWRFADRTNQIREAYLQERVSSIRTQIGDAGVSSIGHCEIKRVLEHLAAESSVWEKAELTYPLIALHVIRKGSSGGNWRPRDESLDDCDEGLSDLSKLLGAVDDVRSPTRTVVDDFTDVITVSLWKDRKPLLSPKEAVEVAADPEPHSVERSTVLFHSESMKPFESAPFVEGTINLSFVAEIDHPPTLSLRMVLLLVYPIVLTLLLGILLQRIFVAPVHTLSRTMQRIASHKDYHVPDAVAQELASQRGDEIGQLYSRFAEMLQAIRTEKELLEQRVAERTVELRIANKELDDFTHTVAHQLKEPLRNIERCTEFAGRELEQRGVSPLAELTDAASETIRLQEMVSRLLEFARAPKQSLNLRPVDLKELLERVELGMAGRLAELGVVLRRPASLPTVVGDDQLLYHVFQNLISNAAKYNDKPEKWIEVGSLDEHEPGFCTVFVKDNGIGIRANDQNKVFTIFTQLHDPRKYGGGAGAGLSIVERIIKRHGGTIRFESQEGRGTTFFVMLPTGEHQPDAQARDSSSD